MSTSVSQLLHMLQQENLRLRDESKAQQLEITALHQNIGLLAELYRLSHELAAEEDLLELLDRLLYRVIEVTRAGDGSLSVLDPDTRELVFILVHGEARQTLPGYRIPADAGVAGWVLSEGQPAIVNNPQQDWRFSTRVDREFAFLTRSILCVPMLSQGRPVGVVELLNKPGIQPFTEVDVALVSVFSQLAAQALAKMQPPPEPISA